MEKVLIDTDVILDFFFDRKPFSEDSSKVLALCETRRLQGFVTPVMISNIYYILRRVDRHEKVIENLKMLMNIIEVSAIQKTTVLKALNSAFKDFEDALQNFSAEDEAGVSIIITRNIKDYKISNLSVMTPAIYLSTIALVP